MKKSPAKKSGFTLIEIVIVLAIAALIMVIVFVAVQGAQRSRRDTTARNSASQALAAMEQYASNNSGTYPTAAIASYMTNIPDAALWTTNPTAIFTGPRYIGSKTCDSTKTSIINGTAGQAAVIYWSESSGGVVCINN
jgi:prepilin-type N-terminal cleavage/methylation domain-containing protein